MSASRNIVLAVLVVAIALGVALIIYAFKGRQSQARRITNWRQRP
jgi:flagellar basal body-associated protein FliL